VLDVVATSPVFTVRHGCHWGSVKPHGWKAFAALSILFAVVFHATRRIRKCRARRRAAMALPVTVEERIDHDQKLVII
jgi:hypothetical protein